MKLIKLHDINGAKPFYLNADTIHAMNRSANITYIYDQIDGNTVRVKETPEEIIALIGGGVPKIEEKEARWFAVNYEEDVTLNVSSDILSHWINDPTEDTEKFIQLAEEFGTVYTDEGFMYALNMGEVSTDTHYFFRTTNY